MALAIDSMKPPEFGRIVPLGACGIAATDPASNRKMIEVERMAWKQSLVDEKKASIRQGQENAILSPSEMRGHACKFNAPFASHPQQSEFNRAKWSSVDTDIPTLISSHAFYSKHLKLACENAGKPS